MSGKTIALVNLNRRSGKTTSALNLGVELAARGSSVLVVDASTDGQLSQLPGLSDTGVVLERREERMVMRGTALDGLAVLCRAGHVLNHPAGVSDNIETLRRLQEQFDWVIYDTHSGDCSALRHVLSIAESVLIPLQPDLRSVELLPPTLSLLLDLHRKGAPAALEAIFFAHTTRAGSGTDSRQAMDCYTSIQDSYPKLVLKAVVPYKAARGEELLQIPALSVISPGSTLCAELAGELEARFNHRPGALIPIVGNRLDMAATLVEPGAERTAGTGAHPMHSPRSFPSPQPLLHAPPPAKTPVFLGILNWIKRLVNR
jgi:cellulose biosynthesis protein BcsQ